MNADPCNTPATDSARQALALGIAIERHNAERFQEWALRFRAYDTAMALFLEALVVEERDHERQLVALYRETFNEPPPPPGETPPELLQDYLPRFAAFGEHFFIINEWGAYSLLSAALDIERCTRDFYASLQRRTADPVQAQMYRRLSAFEAEHERAFEAQLARLTQREE